MANLTYLKPERVWIKGHPELTERWVQDVIADDPTVLGLGDLILKDKERAQPHAGRLDLLLQDSDAARRYEVEIQLGKTDESHVIRTIEYWDVERKRYPQYEHCAVIVAEDITSRFLNVISLFNGFIPLIALQMNALKIGDSVALVFTKVLDQLTLGLVEEDEEVTEVTDRAYWEKRGAKETVALVDELLNILHEFDPAPELKYNKFYIGLARNGQSDNYVIFRAKKQFVRMELRMEKNQPLEEKVEEAGLDLMELGHGGRMRIKLRKSDISKNRELVTELMKAAYEGSKS
jgi:predicted transport protein